MCVCEFQATLRISQPNAYKHLKILEESGLIESQKDGMWVNCFLADSNHSPFGANLLGNLKHWMNHDPAVADLIKKAPFINREEICKP